MRGLIFVAFLLSGCAADLARQEAEMAAFDGCFCSAKRCASVTSASGKAAQAAASTGNIGLTPVGKP